MRENDVTNILIDGKNLYKTPSNVEVETEIIRNTERALDGTMCIDVVAKKLGLKISWDLLTNDAYKKIRNHFPFGCTFSVTSEGTLFSREDYCLKRHKSEENKEEGKANGEATEENGEEGKANGEATGENVEEGEANVQATEENGEEGEANGEEAEVNAPASEDYAHAHEELFTCYVDTISALPVFIEENLYWQNVTVHVVEV